VDGRRRRGELGLEIVEATVSTSAEVQQAAESLDVDGSTCPRQHCGVALESIFLVAEDKQILTIRREGDLRGPRTVAPTASATTILGFLTARWPAILKGGGRTGHHAVGRSSPNCSYT
jgi:putative ABC transport system substrate-binding protein